MSEVKKTDFPPLPEPSKPIESGRDNSESGLQTDSSNSENVVRVGIRNLMLVAKFKEDSKDEVKRRLEQLPNLGSKRVFMYSLDEVVDLFGLTDFQKKKLKDLATKRRNILSPQEKKEKSVAYDAKERILNANQVKIDSLLEANKILKNELKVLKRELKL